MAAKRQTEKHPERNTAERRMAREASPRPAARRAPATRPTASKSDRLRTDRVLRVASRQPDTRKTPTTVRRSVSSTPPTPPLPRRSTKTAAKQTQTPPPPISPDETTASDRNIWFSLILFFMAGYLAVSTISYLTYWSQDQNIASWGNLFAPDSGQDALNWGGPLGAVLSNTIIGRWFGIFGELFPLLIFFIAVKLLKLKLLRLRRAIRSTILVMIVGSIAAGHFYGPNPQVFGSGWGGAHGIFIAQWLQSIIGDEGTSLLVVAAFFGTLYYANGLLIRRWAAKLRDYNRRKREENRLRMEMARLEAQERMLRMRNTIEQRRQELAHQQAEQAAAEAAMAAAVPDTTGTPSLSVPKEPNEVPTPENSTPKEQEVETAQTPLSDPATPVSPQPEPVPQPATYMPAPSERAQLVQNYDGSWGYLMGYDAWGQAIIYTFDVAAYYYNRYYGTTMTPTAQVAPQTPPVPTTDNRTDMEPEEEENPFTLETRPAMPQTTEMPSAPSYTETTQQSTWEPTANPSADLAEVPIPNEEPAPAPEPVMRSTSFETASYPDEAHTPASKPISLNPTVEPTPAVAPAVSHPQPAPVTFTPEADDPGFIVEQPEEEQVSNEVINSSDLYDPTLELSHYRKPPIELLDDHTKRVTVTDEELVENKNRIVTTLENFGIRIDTIEATIGPTVTLYEIVPAPGVRISKIKNLEDDIALSLSALGIRIIAPIPGKGTVGIEVPNKDKEVVSMYSVIKSPKFHDSHADLPVALGKTIQNETFVFDLAKMPHLLVAGATGQGKSVGLNAIITSLLYKKHPAELKFILVDPKKVELTLYSKLEKHFLAKMPSEEEAIITDTQKVIYTLNSLCIEMDARYDLLKAAQVRNIKEYNEKFINRRLNPEKGHRFLPYFVVIVDEFADLIMTAGREIETPIARIAQLARAVGIHLIIATQRPTTNIITGVIKANFPARIAFRVTSMIDSRTILDQPGANQLVGRGDMLISTGSEITRVQCAFIDTPEVERITEYIQHQQGYVSAYELPEYTPEGEESSGVSSDVLAKRDSLFEEVARYVVANQQGSASTIQRKFSIGFNRAGRLIDQLEAAGIVGPSEGGGKPRQVLVSDPMSLEMILDDLS